MRAGDASRGQSQRESRYRARFELRLLFDLPTEHGRDPQL